MLYTLTLNCMHTIALQGQTLIPFLEPIAVHLSESLPCSGSPRDELRHTIESNTNIASAGQLHLLDICKTF